MRLRLHSYSSDQLVSLAQLIYYSLRRLHLPVRGAKQARREMSDAPKRQGGRPLPPPPRGPAVPPPPSRPRFEPVDREKVPIFFFFLVFTIYFVRCDRNV